MAVGCIKGSVLMLEFQHDCESKVVVFWVTDNPPNFALTCGETGCARLCIKVPSPMGSGSAIPHIAKRMIDCPFANLVFDERPIKEFVFVNYSFLFSKKPHLTCCRFRVRNAVSGV